MPKYRSWKTWLVTLPSSGTGVTESLALDHAPFTRMTPVGTFVSGCRLFEKSPPFFGASCAQALWPDPSKRKNKPKTTKKRDNSEPILLLPTLVDTRAFPLKSFKVFRLSSRSEAEAPAAVHSV